MSNEALKKPWLDEAVLHVATLCAQAQKYVDPGDTVPTGVGLKKAVQILDNYKHASAPTIAISVNGDIVFSWFALDEAFKIFVRPNGEVSHYRNNVLVDQETFASLVSNPA